MTPAIVVLGATGVIGSGVVHAALDAGRTVIAVARDAARLDALFARDVANHGVDRHDAGGLGIEHGVERRTGDLHRLRGSVAGDADAAALAGALRELHRPIAGIVACLCGPVARGRILDQPVEALRRELDEDLAPHFAAARHLLPLLAESDRGSSYVLIGGPGGEHPWAGYGHRSVCSAALRMLARVLHDEARAWSVRVQMLAVDSPVRTECNRDHAATCWPSALDVGRRALALVDRTDASSAIVRHAGAATPAGNAPQTTRAPPPVLQRDPSLLPARCQHDAGKLLRSLIAPLSPSTPSPSSHPNQEFPSP